MLNTVIYGSVTLFNLITAVFLVVVFVFVSKGVSIYLRRILKEKMRVEHLEIILRVAYYGILVTAALIILPILGIKLSGLLVAGGIVGLAVGFASQSIVGNLISGLFLMVERPIKIGNAVNIDGTVGIVQEIRIISTTLRTFDGLYIRVPNQKVFTANITNYSAHQVRRFDYLIGIRYSDDADKALEIIKGMIDDHPLTLINPPPQVFVDNLGESSVNIVVRIWAPATEWYGVKMELLWKMKKALEEGGIQIPFPQRTVWLAKEAGEGDAEIAPVV